MAAVEAVQHRPRAGTMQSTDSKWSHKSKKSNGSNKLDLTESPKDKLKIHGKADPSKALTELQPAAEALQQSTLNNMRKESFTGRDGMPIHEPDSSNPSRYRWERPLQTIAGFEDDINRTHREKIMSHHSYSRPQSRADMFSRAESRRNSYFGAYNQGAGSQVGGYYRNSTAHDLDDPQSPQTSYANPHHNSYGNSYGPNRGSRIYPDSGYGSRQAGEYQPPYSNQNQNPKQNQHPSAYRDMVTPSPETDQMNSSTNPSSYNNSYDQLGNPLTQGPHSNGNQPPITEKSAMMTTSPTQMTGSGFPPQQNNQIPMGGPVGGPVGGGEARPRVPMKLDTGVDKGDGGYQFHQKKRASWFKRRFSKEY